MTTITTLPAGALRMSLADVARAAKVQRPVVTMWRSRHASGQIPFPEPLVGDGDQLWDASAVAVWFRRWQDEVGRVPGNNESVVEDLPRYARIDSSALDGATAETVTALLTVAAVTGADLADLSVDSVRQLALEVDPDDEFLLRELRTSPIHEHLLLMCDELANAAFSARAALEAVAAVEVARMGPVFAPELTALLVESAITLAGTLDVAGIEFGLRTTALVDVGLAIVEREPLVQLRFATQGDAACRLALRRLRGAGASVAIARVDDPALDGPGILLGDTISLPVRESLDVVDETVLQLDSNQLAIFVGRAAALTSPLGDVADVTLRDHWLRSGQLRFVAKLPAGVLPRQHSARLSMAMFGPAASALSQRELMVVTGDLGNVTLADLSAQDVATDIVVATRAHDLQREHLLRTAHLVGVPGLLAAGSDLSRRVVADAAVDPSRRVDRSIALVADDLWSRVGGQEAQWQLIAEAGPSSRKAFTLEQAIRAGWARLVPGQRIRDDHVGTGDRGVRVIGTPELRGNGARTIDRVKLEWRYATTRFTQAGDVVFSSADGALVDDVGDCVVQAPARVLRITEEGRAAGLSPEVIAFDLARQSSPARDVKLTRIRSVAPDQVDRLAAANSFIAARRAELHAELNLLAQLDQTLVESVASGYARIEPTAPTAKD